MSRVSRSALIAQAEATNARLAAALAEFRVLVARAWQRRRWGKVAEVLLAFAMLGLVVWFRGGSVERIRRSRHPDWDD